MLICQAMERVANGTLKRVLISVPPRHGKSSICSETFAPWYFGNNPKGRIILASYSSSLSDTFSRRARNTMQTQNYQDIFETKLAEDSQSVKTWHTTDGGYMLSSGVGGAITGRGGDILILDDYFSNREDSESEVMSDKLWDWYTSTFYTRQQKDAAIVIIATRWAETDLIGRLLAEEEAGHGDKWEKITLPAIAVENERWRAKDEALWESTYPVQKLLQTKNVIGSRDFEALYQQNPLNEGGGHFKREYFVKYDSDELRGKDLEIVTFIDPAISLKQSADYSAIVTIGRDKLTNNIYILDVFHNRCEPDELVDTLFDIVKTWQPKKVGIEVVAYQKMLALEVRKQMRLRNSFFQLEEVRPMGEKEARILSTLQPRYSNHSIIHYGTMCDVIESELLRFPDGAHDDAIDALAGAVHMLKTTAQGLVSNTNITTDRYSNKGLTGRNGGDNLQLQSNYNIYGNSFGRYS